MAKRKLAFSEIQISQAHSFGLDVLVRLAKAFPDHCCVDINMLGDAWRDLLDARLRGLEQYQ